MRQPICDDEQHCVALEILRGDVDTKFAEINGLLKVATEGVSNFRNFQFEARDFFTESRTRAIEEEKQRNKRDQEIKEHLKTTNETMTRNIAKRSAWWTAAGVFVAVAAVLVSICTICAMLYLAKHADIEPNKIFSVHLPEWAYNNPQMAGSDQ